MSVNGPNRVRAATQAVAQAVSRPESESRAVAVAVLKKALEAQKAEGKAVVDLLQPKGRYLDVRA